MFVPLPEFSPFLFSFSVPYFPGFKYFNYLLQDSINFWCLDVSSPLIRRHERELT